MVQTVGGAWGFTERPAVMVIPGGGYAMCSDGEAEIVAYPYLAAGFHAFVLRYSVGEHRAWPNPLDDFLSIYGHFTSSKSSLFKTFISHCSQSLA